MAMFGSGVVELTRYRAEHLVKGLVKSGDLSPGGAPAMVQEILERSRQTRKELTRFVRDEIKNQIEGLGLASQRELDRLERRITRLEDNLKKVREESSSVRSLDRRVDKLESAATGPGKKATAKKTIAKKPTAKKSTTARAVTDAPAPGAPGGTE